MLKIFDLLRIMHLLSRYSISNNTTRYSYYIRWFTFKTCDQRISSTLLAGGAAHPAIETHHISRPVANAFQAHFSLETHTSLARDASHFKTCG